MRVVIILLFLHASSGFLITDVKPGLIMVAPGEAVTLFCAVDDDYEWCKFYHPSGQFCDFEWKRSEGNITMQECVLKERVAFHGKYNDRECGITFTATEEDTGIWKCEIEEYVTWMSRGAGRVQTAQMNVTVHAAAIATTTPPPTPTTLSSLTAKDDTTTLLSTTLSSTTLSSTTLSSTTLSSTTLPSTTLPSTIPSSTRPSSIRPSSIILSTTKLSSTTKSKQASDSVKILDDENPEAVPQVDENDNVKTGGSYVRTGGSSSVLISVVVVILIVVVAVVGGFFYRRKKNISTASIVYEREAKLTHDQTSMVSNSDDNITFHSNDAESSNLHEYYPPNLSHSTTTPASQA